MSHHRSIQVFLQDNDIQHSIAKADSLYTHETPREDIKQCISSDIKSSLLEGRYELLETQGELVLIPDRADDIVNTSCNSNKCKDMCDDSDDSDTVGPLLDLGTLLCTPSDYTLSKEAKHPATLKFGSLSVSGDKTTIDAPLLVLRRRCNSAKQGNITDMSSPSVSSGNSHISSSVGTLPLRRRPTILGKVSGSKRASEGNTIYIEGSPSDNNNNNNSHISSNKTPRYNMQVFSEWYAPKSLSSSGSGTSNNNKSNSIDSGYSAGGLDTVGGSVSDESAAVCFDVMGVISRKIHLKSKPIRQF